ncbi:uncharacterized protein LOC115623381 [Scaptodrosophila lebanonensis]|uniref:Uncharacterized protein LOC115623381 n=1 Tax=Drosophila lebanonensis TaxID=7225 RepID=A0A6J2TEJ9_DROLE|nr:uncharacterized protein LOC115623381 [Scaptodrosophila lebanonensis]
MSRLSSSTYSSICFLVLSHIVWLLLLAITATARPASAAPANQHIVSFVNQTNTIPVHKEFDFEQSEAEATNSVHVQQLFSSLLSLTAPQTNDALDNNLDMDLSLDDAPISSKNTLNDELTLEMASEGSTKAPDTLNRVKLNIPVLEPVRHLVNAVGGGAVNDTHVRNNHHRLLGHSGVHHAPHHSNGNESSAIETEEDRETAIESTGFDLLETLGTTGTVLWGFLQNLRQLFAASVGGASTASSGGGGTSGTGSQ